MKSPLGLWLPILAAILLLTLLRSLDLLLIVAPISAVVSVLAARGAKSGQRRM